MAIELRSSSAGVGGGSGPWSPARNASTTAEPTPRAIAKAPTRPTQRAKPAAPGPTTAPARRHCSITETRRVDEHTPRSPDCGQSTADIRKPLHDIRAGNSPSRQISTTRQANTGSPNPEKEGKHFQESGAVDVLTPQDRHQRSASRRSCPRTPRKAHWRSRRSGRRSSRCADFRPQHRVELQAAQLIARFPEINAQKSKREGGIGIDDITEYFVIGSFASWIVALGGMALTFSR
jgi:hypothetical protein